jgi:hypothetical protein
MTLATSSSQLPYDACSREPVMKYSASRTGRNRNKNVGSVNSKGIRASGFGIRASGGLPD